jgi:hypothetical protein
MKLFNRLLTQLDSRVRGNDGELLASDEKKALKNPDELEE